ncbi:MAG: type II secretion system protein [Planctomycetes bacterium]|nr:type II secretion system protein [Planctomycetota bacterium]
MHMRNRRAGANAGFTLTEMLIAATILIGLAGVIAGTMGGLSTMTFSGSVQNQLQDMGERSLSAILDDLRRSGWVTRDGQVYPAFIEDGQTEQSWLLQHRHLPPLRSAHRGEPDFGPSREPVFVLPADADRNNRPDVDINTGELSWDTRHFSYVLVPGPNGHNVLERRIDGGMPQVIAHHVERFTVEDAAETGFEVPLKALRVRLWFRKQDSGGVVHRHRVEAVVQLRNGGLQGDPEEEE